MSPLELEMALPLKRSETKCGTPSAGMLAVAEAPVMSLKILRVIVGVGMEVGIAMVEVARVRIVEMRVRVNCMVMVGGLVGLVVVVVVVVVEKIRLLVVVVVVVARC